MITAIAAQLLSPSNMFLMQYYADTVCFLTTVQPFFFHFCRLLYFYSVSLLLAISRLLSVYHFHGNAAQLPASVANTKRV